MTKTLYHIKFHDAEAVEHFANNYPLYAKKYNLHKGKVVDIVSVCHNGRSYVVFFYIIK